MLLKEKMHLLSIFNLSNHPVLHPELCFIILKFSGLVKTGARGTVMFHVYYPRLIRFPKRKKKTLYIK